MKIRRALADVQDFGDLPGGFSGRASAQNFGFAWTKSYVEVLRLRAGVGVICNRSNFDYARSGDAA